MVEIVPSKGYIYPNPNRYQKLGLVTSLARESVSIYENMTDGN